MSEINVDQLGDQPGANGRTAKIGGAFDPKVMLGLILFGAIAFLATLYFIGSGQTGRNINDGGAHAAGKGLTGYAALAAFLAEEGHDVSLSRSAGNADDYGLLILTPPLIADEEDISAVLEERIYIGPTLVILPKWIAFGLPNLPGTDIDDGWVQLTGTNVPQWVVGLDHGRNLQIEMSSVGKGEEIFDADDEASGPVWTGLSQTGRLPSRAYLSESGDLTPLVRGPGGKTLAGYLQDDGIHPLLESAANVDVTDGPNVDENRYPVAFVVEPDLVNNYGFANPANAEMAHELIDVMSKNGDLPVIFDLTLNGLGTQQNLLTLAFTPPFLAATLCLVLALLVIGWRAFRRFGPPVAEGRAIAFGKAQLVTNSAGFIQRSKRLHLLTAPYVQIVQARIAKALGLRHADPQAIDAAMARKAPDLPPFSHSAGELNAAHKPKDILSAAAALRRIERTLLR